jgi:hypothetical protein
MLKFLKPSLLKMVVTLILFVGLTWLWGLRNMFIMDASFHGLPLTFYTAWGPCQAGQACSEFNGLNFGLDLAFWYFVGAFLVDRLARKPKPS